FKNLIADTYLEEKRAIVNERLMSLIDSSQPSVKALDLYFRRFGLLTERHETVSVESQDASASNEKIEESMAELDELLEEPEGNEMSLFYEGAIFPPENHIERLAKYYRMKSYFDGTHKFNYDRMAELLRNSPQHAQLDKLYIAINLAYILTLKPA